MSEIEGGMLAVIENGTERNLVLVINCFEQGAVSHCNVKKLHPKFLGWIGDVPQSLVSPFSFDSPNGTTTDNLDDVISRLALENYSLRERNKMLSQRARALNDMNHGIDAVQV